MKEKRERKVVLGSREQGIVEAVLGHFDAECESLPSFLGAVRSSEALARSDWRHRPLVSVWNERVGRNGVSYSMMINTARIGAAVGFEMCMEGLDPDEEGCFDRVVQMVEQRLVERSQRVFRQGYRLSGLRPSELCARFEKERANTVLSLVQDPEHTEECEQIFNTLRGPAENKTVLMVFGALLHADALDAVTLDAPTADLDAHLRDSPVLVYLLDAGFAPPELEGDILLNSYSLSKWVQRMARGLDDAATERVLTALERLIQVFVETLYATEDEEDADAAASRMDAGEACRPGPFSTVH